MNLSQRPSQHDQPDDRIGRLLLGEAVSVGHPKALTDGSGADTLTPLPDRAARRWLRRSPDGSTDRRVDITGPASPQDPGPVHQSAAPAPALPRGDTGLQNTARRTGLPLEHRSNWTLPPWLPLRLSHRESLMLECFLRHRNLRPRLQVSRELLPTRVGLSPDRGPPSQEHQASQT